MFGLNALFARRSILHCSFLSRSPARVLFCPCWPWSSGPLTLFLWPSGLLNFLAYIASDLLAFSDPVQNIEPNWGVRKWRNHFICSSFLVVRSSLVTPLSLFATFVSNRAFLDSRLSFLTRDLLSRLTWGFHSRLAHGFSSWLACWPSFSTGGLFSVHSFVAFVSLSL